MNNAKMKTIAEMANQYGLSLRTLRFYEERGLLRPRRDGLSRLYSPHDEIRLQIILKAKRLRFSISEIIALIAQNEGAHAMDGSATLHLKPAVIEQRIESLNRERQSVSFAIDELRNVLARSA